MLRLSDKEVAFVCGTPRTVLLKVEALTGVPWEALAAVWYRESTFNYHVDRVGGPFQFDPIPTNTRMQVLFQTYTTLDTPGIRKALDKGVKDFETGALLCACYLRDKVKLKVDKNASDETIRQALYSYNGRKYKSIEDSAYVMNGYDAQHQNLRIIGTLPDGKGGRMPINKIDPRAGAFTVYKQLKELSHV